MLIAFYILVLQQIAQGLVSLWDGWQWLLNVRRSLSGYSGLYTPRVAVICPCKGAEAGLEANLAAITNFDYPNYEVYFALASALDPAHSIIDRVSKTSKRPTHLVIAGAPQNCSEKVNNLRLAVREAGDKFDVLVFVDSDARLSRSWLAHLVTPLSDQRLGASTTYRWYFPAKGGFASAVLSTWNAAIATQLGEHAGNFCWGGGTAIRCAVFKSANVLEGWKGAVSDDWPLTQALEHAGLPIHFVPECLAPTLLDVTPDSLVEFTNRQMILTRVYSPRRWLYAALAHFSYCFTLVFAAFTILDRMFVGYSWMGLVLLSIVIPLLAAGKGALRTIAVQEVLHDWRAKCEQWSWAWVALPPIIPVLFLWNFLVSAFAREIRWRGIRYQLISPTQTRVLSH